MKVVGVLAGRDMPIEQVRAWLATADLILAADAGADLVREAGFQPHEVIGDFDSIVGDHQAEVVHHDPNQEDTDCDKLLSRAIARGLEKITLIAVEGDQLDHMLATLHSAAKADIRVRVGLRTGIGWVMNRGERVQIHADPGARVSLIPLTPSEGVSLRGVEWPLERTALNPLGPTSISNRALGGEVSAEVFEGAAFLFVESFEPVWDNDDHGDAQP